MTTLKNIFAMQLRLNLEAKNGRRYTILKSKNWFLTFYIIKWTRKTPPEIAVPKSLVPSVHCAYFHLHPWGSFKKSIF
jgi:hypothetical protein